MLNTGRSIELLRPNKLFVPTIPPSVRTFSSLKNQNNKSVSSAETKSVKD